MSDDERREVAERLKGYVSEWRDMPSFSVQKGVACSLGIVRFDVESQLLRLVELIKPSESKVKCIAEVKIDGEKLEELVHNAVVELTGIDRDALLALADEMDHTDSEVGWTDDAMPHFARRIREALGA